MSDYESKYLKYKNKYLGLRKKFDDKNLGQNGEQNGGGLFGLDLDFGFGSSQDTTKIIDEIPPELNKFVNMAIIPNTEIATLGSLIYKDHKYFSDEDENVVNIIHQKIPTDKLVGMFVDDLKRNIKRILTKTDVYFTGFKAGGMDWSAQEILDEKKLDNNNISLIDASKIKSPIRLCLTCNCAGKYKMLSIFYVLKSSDGFINIDEEQFTKYLDMKQKLGNNEPVVKKFTYTQTGGLIGEILPEIIDSVKSDDEIPTEIKDYIKMITIPDTDVIRVGSSMTKIQPYFSDIDIMNIVHKKLPTDQFVRFFINELKKLITNAIKIPNVFFSDFKAAGLHWSIEQIMAEKHGELSLASACTVKDVVKLDIIGPYDGRYIELSSFYILKSLSEFVNVESDYFDKFVDSLLKDISKYQIIKPFKAVKRTWSLSRLKKKNKELEVEDLNRLKLLKDLIRSNIALLSQMQI
jgi:hypothetical protein